MDVGVGRSVNDMLGGQSQLETFEVVADRLDEGRGKKPGNGGAPVIIKEQIGQQSPGLGNVVEKLFRFAVPVKAGGGQGQAVLALAKRFHLPGDITFRSGNVTVYFPIATSIILSVILTVVLNVLFRQR